jgi:hypothetical protein
VLPDQNGWSRYLHFQAAWAAVLTGLLYAVFGLLTGHFRKNLLPAGASPWRALWSEIANHLRFKPPGVDEAWSYNVLQRLTYLLVIFVLFPLVIWTGLAMSPAIVSAFPATVTVFGGQQSTHVHFFVSVFLVLFLLVTSRWFVLPVQGAACSHDHRPRRHLKGMHEQPLTPQMDHRRTSGNGGRIRPALAANLRIAMASPPITVASMEPAKPHLCCPAFADAPLVGP